MGNDLTLFIVRLIVIVDGFCLIGYHNNQTMNFMSIDKKYA